MKLSMSMLKWYLREYQPDSYIVQDRRIIEGLRFLMDENISLSPRYVYFGPAANFFSGEKYHSAYMIVNGKSRLMVSGCEYVELLNVILSAFDYFSMWENRLLEAAAAHAPLQELADIGAEVIENPFFVSSFSGNVTAHGRMSSVPDKYWDSVIGDKGYHFDAKPLHLPYYTCDGEVIRNLSERPMLVRNVWEEGEPVLMMYLFIKKEAVTAFSIKQDDKEMTEMDMQMSVILAGYMIKAEEFYGTSAVVKPSVTLLRECLDGNLVDAGLLQDLQDKFSSDVWRLAVIRHVTRDDHIQKTALIKKLLSVMGVYIAFDYDASVLAIMSEETCSNGLSRCGGHVDLGNLCIGLSMPATGLKDLPIYYRQAEFALECRKGAAGVARCEEHAFTYLLDVLRGQPMAEDLYHPAIDVLGKYDILNGGGFERTLYVYLRNDMNLAETAQRLNIHRNTLKYRLKRIRELTGLDFKDRGDREYLMLSFWLKYRDPEK